jgi:hypothetical protein
MKLVSALVLAGLMLPLASVAACADHEESLTIINHSKFEIRGVSIKPVKVIAFKAIPPGNKRTFKIQVPDGVCDVVMSTTFDDDASDKNDIEVCGGMTFTWSTGRF